IRWIVGIQDLGGLPPENQLASAVGGVGRHVHDLGRVANRPRGKKELFILALSAIEHWSNTEAVRENLSTDACHTIVNGKLVLDAVQRVFENRIAKLRKGLDILNLIVIDDGKFTERPITIGFGRIRPVGPRRKASLVGAGDDRIQVRGYYVVVDIEHLELVVIKDRLTTGRGADFRCRHLRRGNLRAVPFSAANLDVDTAK